MKIELLHRINIDETKYCVEVKPCASGIAWETYFHIKPDGTRIYGEHRLTPCPAAYVKSLILALATNLPLPYLINIPCMGMEMLDGSGVSPWEAWYTHLTTTNSGSTPSYNFKGGKKLLAELIKDVDFYKFDSKLASKIAEPFIRTQSNTTTPEIDVELLEVGE